MKVGGYSLDLYCDNDQFMYTEPEKCKHGYNESPVTFVGNSLAGCLRQAKECGWSLGKERDYCPKCNPRSREK